MTIATPVRVASEKQRSLIKTLLTERDIAPGIASAAALAADATDLSLGDASKLITEFMKAPRKPKAVPAKVAPVVPRVGWDEVDALLPDLPDAKYAIRIDDFTDALITGMSAGQPMVFFEKRTFRGRTMLKKLLGAPGGFSRVTMTPAANLAVIRALSPDPIAASRLFGETYSCCGKCGAELTDEISRRTQFGPTCRAVLGVEV